MRPRPRAVTPGSLIRRAQLPRAQADLLRQLVGRRDVRLHTTAAFVGVKKALNVPSLMQAVVHSDANVRFVAAFLLSIANPSSRYLERIVHAIKAEGEPKVRKFIVSALRATKDQRAVSPLIEELKHGDAKVRDAAIKALAAFRDPRSINPLCAVLRDDSNAGNRRHAAAVLGMIGDPTNIGPLSNALADLEPQVRMQAVIALGLIGKKEILPSVRKALTDPDERVRDAAQLVLLQPAGEPEKGKTPQQLLQEKNGGGLYNLAVKLQREDHKLATVAQWVAECQHFFEDFGGQILLPVYSQIKPYREVMPFIKKALLKLPFDTRILVITLAGIKYAELKGYSLTDIRKLPAYVDQTLDYIGLRPRKQR